MTNNRDHGSYLEWAEVYDTFAKKGIKVIPVDYDDMNIVSPEDMEFLVPIKDATTDLNRIKEWGSRFCYYAIQIGSRVSQHKIFIIRFKDLEKHDAFVKKYGAFPKTAVIASPTHRDYIYKLNRIDELYLKNVKSKDFELLYNNEFIIVPPSWGYRWLRGGFKDLKRIPYCPPRILTIYNP